MRYRLMVCCLSLPRDEHSQQVTATSALFWSVHLPLFFPLPVPNPLAQAHWHLTMCDQAVACAFACSAGCCISSCLHIKYTHYVYALAKLSLIEQLAMGRIYWAKFQYECECFPLPPHNIRKKTQIYWPINLAWELESTWSRQLVCAWQWYEMQIESWIGWHSRISHQTKTPFPYTENRLLSLQAS